MCVNWKISWSVQRRFIRGAAIEAVDLQLAPDEMGGENPGRGSETLDDYLNRLERQAILEALQKTEGNRTAAARLLGVTFRSLRYRLERRESTDALAGRWLAQGHALGAFAESGERPAGSAVSLVVLHSISLPPDDFAGNWVERFFLNRLDPQAHPNSSTIAGLQVSAHFLIRRDGQVIQFVGCDRRAWHAGQSSTWQGRENCNDYSVGIELEGSDSQPFTAAQYAALWPLIR